MARARRIITTRAGGSSQPPYDTFNLSLATGDQPGAVEGNRARLAASMGLGAGRLVWMRQVHGATVHVVDSPDSPQLLAGDALVTTQLGLALLALVADCVPVLLAEPVAGVVAVAHAGRRGAAAGIATATVAAMAAQGADPARIDVLLGPAVCGACYEVPAQMRDEVDAALPGSASSTSDGRPSLDLRAGLAGQLQAAGVGTVIVDPACTLEDDRFYSYRRDGVTGRFVGAVWLQ